MELLTQAITQLQVEYMFETEMFAVIKNVASVSLRQADSSCGPESPSTSVFASQRQVFRKSVARWIKDAVYD